MILFWIFVAVVVLFGFVVAFGAPYVPSLRGEVRSAFRDLYPLGSDDLVVDLGAGDGVVLQEAVRRGARGVGYEINPLLVLTANLRLRGQATVRMRNMWAVDLPQDTSLVYVFSVTRDSKRLGRYLQHQADKRGSVVTVMTFGTGLKDYQPTRTLKAHSLYEIHPARSAMQS